MPIFAMREEVTLRLRAEPRVWGTTDSQSLKLFGDISDFDKELVTV